MMKPNQMYREETSMKDKDFLYIWNQKKSSPNAFSGFYLLFNLIPIFKTEKGLSSVITNLKYLYDVHMYKNMQKLHKLFFISLRSVATVSNILLFIN